MDDQQSISTDPSELSGSLLVAESDVALVVDDNDSAIGEGDAESSTASLRSSLLSFASENGRLYHSMSKGKYILPADEDENERLDLQHTHFWITFNGRQHFAPGADTAQRVLDVGTGTGIWAIEFADEHPDAEVIGVDLAPIQPPFVPPNCRFELDDVEKEWTWNRSFDYIFSRMMVGSFANWDSFIKQAYDNLEPGGWLELIDSAFPIESDDGTLNDSQVLMKWINMLVEASNNLGRPLADARHHKDRLIRAGFVNVEKKTFKWPTNTWPKDRRFKEVGRWTLANVDGGLEGLSMALLTRGIGMSKDEVLSFLTGVRRDLRDPSIHGYWPIYVVYGQKPGKPVAETAT